MIPTTDRGKWDMQQHFRDYPWPTVAEPEPEQRVGRASHAGWLWHPGGLLTPITREEKPSTRVNEMALDELCDEVKAWHEAGHTASAEFFGNAIVGVSINSTESYNGITLHYEPRKELLQKLTTMVAGGVAEEIRFDRVMTDADTSACADAFKRAGVSLPEIEPLMGEAVSAAFKILRARWHRVTEIAEALKVHRTLGPEWFGQDNVRQVQLHDAANATQVRRVELPLQTRSGAATFDAKANTVEVIWGTGARVLRNGWDGRYWEDLPVENADLGFLNSGRAPFLNSHQSERVSDVLGVVTAGSAYTRDGKGYATIRLGSNAPRSDLESGVLANVSIGYSVGKMRELPAGSDGIPVMRVEAYKIKEVSLVGIGADEGAQVRYECEVQA